MLLNRNDQVQKLIALCKYRWIEQIYIVFYNCFDIGLSVKFPSKLGDFAKSTCVYFCTGCSNPKCVIFFVITSNFIETHPSLFTRVTSLPLSSHTNSGRINSGSLPQIADVIS